MAVVTQTMQDQVTELYLGFFGRAPDAAGFGYWTNALANGGATVNSIANAFATTPEFTANYLGLTPVQQVTKIYNNVLNRAPDAGGLTYWTGLLKSGSSIGSVVYGIVNAAFSQVGTADGLLVQNKVTVGEYFAITLASNDTALASTAYNQVTSAASSVATAEAAISQGSGGTWALTTGIDTLTKGPYANFVGTVTGAAPATQGGTLNAGDTLTGVGAGNVLKVVDTSGAAAGLTPMAGVSMVGVQELQVQSAGGASTNDYNVSTTTGVTRVNSANSTASGVTFSGLAAGTEVMVSGSASAANNVTNYSYTSGTSAATVTFSGGVNSQRIQAVAAGAVNMAPTSAVINSIGGVNGTTSAGAAAAETVRFNSAGTNTLTSLTVHASTNLRTNLTAGDFAAAGAALVVDGAAGSVNLGNLGAYKTIDASGLAGGLTVNASTTLTSFTGGKGNDSLTNNAANNAAIAATASIDAGLGVDTVAGTLVNAGNAAIFKNFEQIALASTAPSAAVNLDVSLMTNSTITGATISGALVGASSLTNLVENASGFNVSVTGSAGNATTLGFTAASVSGAADAINYSFGATGAGAVNAGNITHQGIEIINIASGGTTGAANVLAVTDDNATTVTIKGANAINFQVAAQNLVGAATATALTTVDASALTGTASVFTFLDNNPAAAAAVATGLTIKGGAAADNITVFTQSAAGHVNTALFGADTVNLAAGGNDLVVVGTGALGAVVGALSQLGTATGSPNSFAFTTITGAAAGDQIQFGAAAAMAAGTAAVNVTGQQSLLGAVNLAVGGNNAVTWFQMANNTYIVANVDNVAGFGAGDIVVQLTGLVDLSTSVAAAGTLVLA